MRWKNKPWSDKSRFQPSSRRTRVVESRTDQIGAFLFLRTVSIKKMCWDRPSRPTLFWRRTCFVPKMRVMSYRTSMLLSVPTACVWWAHQWTSPPSDDHSLRLAYVKRDRRHTALVSEQMNTNDAAATLITYLLCCETVTRGLTRFVIHHCTYEGTEIVRRETRPIDSLGSILKVHQNRVHIHLPAVLPHVLTIYRSCGWAYLIGYICGSILRRTILHRPRSHLPRIWYVWPKCPYEPCCRQTIDSKMEC